MYIAKEAAYLYIYSKELTKVNKNIRRLSKRAQKHADKHNRTTDEEKKLRHKVKHRRVTNDINSLVKRHNAVVSRLKHHMINFHDALRKEHKL